VYTKNYFLQNIQIKEMLAWPFFQITFDTFKAEKYITDMCKRYIPVCYFIDAKSLITVKSFNFVGAKFRCLKATDMFVDTRIHGFIIFGKQKLHVLFKYFVGILNLWIALPTKYTKLNVRRMKTILQITEN